MRVVLRAIEYLYEKDPILRALVGQDEWGEWKVYPQVAPQGTSPPWVVYQLVPGPPPEGHYGDGRAIRAAPVQFRAWAENREQAWQIMDALDDMLDNPDIDIELTPFNQMLINLVTTPGEDLETETGLYNVTADYTFVVSR